MQGWQKWATLAAVLTAVAVGGLAGTTSTATTTSSATSGSAPVTIVNPAPVPVMVSGPISGNITGTVTGTVAVSNLPAQVNPTDYVNLDLRNYPDPSYRISSTGEITQFQIPSGKVLVITDVELSTACSAVGGVIASVTGFNAVASQETTLLDVVANCATANLHAVGSEHLSHGLVIDGGQEIHGTPPKFGTTLRAQGYLKAK